jgi:hypothetical protein
MRVWAFTLELLLGLVSWGSVLDGGTDEGIVTAMEDPFPPPRP